MKKLSSCVTSSIIACRNKLLALTKGKGALLKVVAENGENLSIILERNMKNRGNNGMIVIK